MESHTMGKTERIALWSLSVISTGTAALALAISMQERLVDAGPRIRTQELVIERSDGQQVAILGADSEHVALRMFAPGEERSRAIMYVDFRVGESGVTVKDGRGHRADLYAHEGKKQAMLAIGEFPKVRVSLGLSDKWAGLSIADPEGSPRADLAWFEEVDGCGMYLRDKLGEPIISMAESGKTTPWITLRGMGGKTCAAMVMAADGMGQTVYCDPDGTWRGSATISNDLDTWKALSRDYGMLLAAEANFLAPEDRRPRP